MLKNNKKHLESIRIKIKDLEKKINNKPLNKLILNSYPFSKNELINHLFTANPQENLKFDEIEILNKLNNISKKEILSEIKFENRRYYQFNQLLNYSLSNYSYFDFFSSDTFKIAIEIKTIAQDLKKNTALISYFLIAYCNKNLNIQKTLEPFGFNDSFVKSYASQLLKDHNKNSFNFLKIIENLRVQFRFFLNLFNEKKKDLFYKSFLNLNKKITFSNHVLKIFKKCSINAIKRFKIPIITSEMLFITLMEDPNISIFQEIKNILKNDYNWYLLRYKLLKNIHFEEIELRKQVSKNQRFFAYLLKKEMSEINFKEMLDRNILGKSVETFRNSLVNRITKLNIFKKFAKETKISIKTNIKRLY